MNRLLLRAFAFLALFSPGIRAQSSTRVLPESLVNALLGGLDRPAAGVTPEYFVGTLPTGFPAALVPSGPVSVVGGARAGDQMVVVLADSTRRLSAVMEELLKASGYSAPGPIAAAGFSSASGPYHYFCRDSSMVSTEPVLGQAHEMTRVSYHSVRGRSCSSLAPGPLPGTLKLPPLRPLPHTHVMTSGGGGGNNEVNSRGLVSGESLDPAVLLAHYAAQLVQAGWTADTPAIGTHVAAQFFEAADDAGQHWQGTMMVSGSSTAMNLALVMRAH